MNKKLVIAVDGKKYPIDECRKIKGEYYKIGNIAIKDSGNCYYINDKYYKYNTGYIVYDYRLNKYVIKNSMVIVENGIVSLENDKPIFGSFSKNNLYENIFLNIKGNLHLCISDDIFKNSFNYRESLKDGIFYERTQCDSIHFITPQPVDNIYKRSLSYDCSKYLNKAIKDYEFINKNIEISETINKYGDFIKDYTFGFEFETIKGCIPERINKKLGLIPVRDGSIKGLEYVTIPLSGKKGLESLKDCIYELNKRTVYDNDCSLHVHIGNIPRTKEYILALYKILCLLQDDIYNLFPIYKKENYGVKKKCYTKPFPIKTTLLKMDRKINNKNINKNFNILFNYLSMGHDFEDYDNDLDQISSHPSDPQGNGKWNIKTRYHAFNLIPILFGNKQTVEFRIHTPTFDINKIFNYLVLCTSILEYVKINQNNILSNFDNYTYLKLSDIFFSVNLKQTLINDLIKYSDARKKYIYSCISKGNLLAEENEFHYRYNKIKWNKKNIINDIEYIKKKSEIKLNYYNEIDDLLLDAPNVFIENNEVKMEDII